MTQSSDTRAQPSPQLMAAMARIRQGDNTGALALAEEALQEAGDKAPALAIASLAALRSGKPDRAIPHLEALLELKPDDLASRANLANAYLEMGDSTRSLELVKGHPAANLARIEGFIRQQEGDLQGAVAAYRRAVQADRNDLASWNNLGNLLAKLDDVNGAIAALEMAISIAPAEYKIYLNLAEVLREADLAEARLKVLTDARTIAPQNQQVLIELGQAQARLDDLEGAVATLTEAIELSPSFSDAHIELGVIYESLNRTDDLAALVASIDPASAPPEAAFLSAWKARRESNFDEAAKFAAQIPETIHPMRRFHLIGGIADRQGDVATAFEAFERMNREAVAASPPHVGPSYRELVEADLAKWTDDWASGWQNFEATDGLRDPIFLVGFPRSGTTLLDTMLMGQGTLSVLEERPMMARTTRLFGDEDLPDFSADRIHELRAAYFDYAREFGWDDNKWLVDKHPLNMERVPTIRRLFPSARIILAERHPFDVVFSCFMANFQLNLAMRSFTSLDEAARTYDAVFSAWERGIELFPVDYHAVRYERLVEDARAELSPLMDWLGLEWNDRLLDHTETARERGRVRTASYSQIGETLYTRASGRWHRYAAYLAPIAPLLRPWAEKMGYETE